MTPKQFQKYIDVYIGKEKNRATEMDYNNFNLGHYLILAFNKPDKYPDKPFTQKQTAEIMDDNQIANALDRAAILFKGITKKNGT